MWSVEPIQILLAVILDLLLGDPRGWPHITRLCGVLAAQYERLITLRGRRSVMSGILFWILVYGTILGLWFVINGFLKKILPNASWILEIFVIYQTLAAMDLRRHILAILNPLQKGDLPEAREKLSWIVGRDTDQLDEKEISRATLESIAESANDGFVAPLFWAAVGGVPAALLFRASNTLDSIVGHRNERYECFGKFSARVDDLLCWIPARLCVLISMIYHGFHTWPSISKEATAHASPNAGWVEAAAAHSLDVCLGGENFYQGEKITGPIFNPQGRPPQPSDIAAGLRWLWILEGGAVLICLGINLLMNNGVFL
ncbi:MAG: adenosylcobinamide-phosphate synthase CbiB [Verrucomicrobiota bacterium]